MADNLLLPGTDGKFSVYLRGFADKTIEEITDIFSEFGNVVMVKQVNESHFVRYTHKEEAEKAIDAFANNRNVKVAPGLQKGKKKEEKENPRNHSHDHDGTVRNNKYSDNQGNWKSPSQGQDKMTGSRSGRNEVYMRKHGDYYQESDKGVRHFQNLNDSNYVWPHSSNERRNMQHGLENCNGEHSKNNRSRRSDDFKSHGFIKQDSAAHSKDSNVQDKNRSSNTDIKRQTYFHGSKIDHRNPDDNDSPQCIAKEVIIADLPHRIMQADVYRLCEFVDPLHIDIHRIKEDDIVYAHVFVRTNEDVNMLVAEINGIIFCKKKILAMSVEKMLRN